MKKRKNANSVIAKSLARLAFDKVIYLFTEGETELRYLQDLAQGRRVKIVPVSEISTPWLLTSKARDWAWEKRKLFSGSSSNLIWVVFDDDEKTAEIERTKNELHNPPRGFRKGGALPPISIAYMKPCIEIWGAMCVQGNAKGLPSVHTKMESQLKKIMKGYDHNSSRYFDLKQMTKTQQAIDLAMSWEQTYGCFPQCVGSAARFAGIASLVKMIIG